MPNVGCVVSAPYVGATIWNLLATCMRSERLRQGVDLRIRFTSTGAEQLGELDRLLRDGIDALIMKPMEVNSPGWSTFFRSAEAASAVPIVTLDSYIDDAAVVCTVGTDNARAEVSVAERVFERIGRQGRVIFSHKRQDPAYAHSRPHGACTQPTRPLSVPHGSRWPYPGAAATAEEILTGRGPVVPASALCDIAQLCGDLLLGPDRAEDAEECHHETAARWGIRNRTTLVSSYRKYFRETPADTLARRGSEPAALRA